MKPLCTVQLISLKDQDESTKEWVLNKYNLDEDSYEEFRKELGYGFAFAPQTSQEIIEDDEGNKQLSSSLYVPVIWENSRFPMFQLYLNNELEWIELYDDYQIFNRTETVHDVIAAIADDEIELENKDDVIVAICEKFNIKYEIEEGDEEIDDEVDDEEVVENEVQ